MTLSVWKCLSVSISNPCDRPKATSVTQFDKVSLGVAVLRHIACLTIALLVSAGVSLSQQPQQLPGVQMFSSNEFGVDLATGSVNFSIPMRFENRQDTLLECSHGDKWSGLWALSTLSNQFYRLTVRRSTCWIYA